MPGMDGLAVLREARAQGITTPALFLTAKAEIEDRVTGLDAGADDYLPKPFDASEFLARVRALTRRSSAYTPSRLTLGNTVLDCGTYQLRTPYGETRLNNKEYQLMELFLRNPRQVFSSEHLIERIWGLDSESEMEVIWTYIGFLRKKLRQIGADIEIKTIRSLLFITLAVAGGSLLLVFALVVLFSGRAIAPYLRNLAAQKQFITNASHELKTPLTAISTSADVLAMESGENEWVQNIQSQSGRLSRLISSLVTLCRLDEENPFPERTEFSLSDAVWEIAEPFSSLAAAKGKEYTQYIEDGITITDDRTAIGQLVSILLDNAIKYSADCGVIRLHVCRSGKRAEIEVYFTLVLCSGTPFSSITVDKFQGTNSILLFQLWYSHAAPPRKCVHTLCHKERSVFNMIPEIYRPKM